MPGKFLNFKIGFYVRTFAKSRGKEMFRAIFMSQKFRFNKIIFT